MGQCLNEMLVEDAEYRREVRDVCGSWILGMLASLVLHATY